MIVMFVVMTWHQRLAFKINRRADVDMSVNEVTSNRKRYESVLHSRVRWSEASKARSLGFSI